MIKRVCISILILFGFCLLGSAMVGYHIIPGTAGAVVWMIGVVMAIIFFAKSKPRAG